ncbi:MAG TPA: hypothetical protein PK867_22905, partial [Pirellulales bacterium]|nr:hypothetical protein [Pirellulales bacterium]
GDRLRAAATRPGEKVVFSPCVFERKVSPGFDLGRHLGEAGCCRLCAGAEVAALSECWMTSGGAALTLGA